MKRSVLSLFVLLALAPSVRAVECPYDYRTLTVTRGPGAGQVTLSWNGVEPPYELYRSADPSAITLVSNRIAITNENSWVDAPPPGNIAFYAVYTDLDQDGVIDCLDPCAYDPAKLEPGLCGCGVPDTDTDGDQTPDCDDFCDHDPAKAERGFCGCGHSDSSADSDRDGIIDCKDQCPGQDDRLDADKGGLPDACDPCPTGLCDLSLPERFYVELPDIELQRISRDGRLIAGIVWPGGQGVLIPTDRLLLDPTDRTGWEFLPDERTLGFRGFSDDNNIVLVDIETKVPEDASPVTASAIYDRRNATWRPLGLYANMDVSGCHFYSNSGDITSDGRLVYGRTPVVENPCRLKAFQHDLVTGEWQIFGGPEGEVRLVEGTSGNGRAIVGSENRDPYPGGGGVEAPVHWSFAPPSLFTPQWIGDGGTAYDVTFDGSTVSLTHRGQAYKWSQATGLVRLGSGTLDPAWAAHPVAISDGGNIIVGFHVYQLARGLPFIWVAGTAFGSLIDYLRWRGHTDLGGMDMYYVPRDLSGNGRIIVGANGGMSGLPGWFVVTTHP
jgi:hypothetical protein